MNPSNWTFAGVIVVTLLFILRPGCDLPDPVAISVRDYYPPSSQSPTIPWNPPRSGSDGFAQYPNAGDFTQQTSSPNFYAPSTVIIGSFNIKSFGPAKASRPHVMARLVDIARRYDLLAIQELRNEDQSVIQQFAKQINADGSRYSYVIGPRQGYTQSKEQYAYLYDAAKFRLTSEPYVVADPRGSMHRPPLIASFQCTQAPDDNGFTFTVLNLHIDPDVVDQELTALNRFMPAILDHHADEDDFLILGDFNDNAQAIQQFPFLQNQLPLVRTNWPTKIRTRRSIDNIVIDGARTAEYANQSGVLNLQQQYRLNVDQALEISDHHPVWGVFSTIEAQDRIVQQNTGRRSTPR